MADQTRWKNKLAAFLHDPPCKCFDIPGHAKRAAGFRSEAGISPEEYAAFEHDCDRIASAADRFPFPDPRTSGLRSTFTGGEDAPFNHPLGGGKLVLHRTVETADAAEERFQESIKGVPATLDNWRIKFFLYWRRWPEESALHDPRLAFLPADTRLPDHTIWNHMSLTSALQACVVDGQPAPAFLIFQLGPVQDFIAQARKTRDLWSGSYLLSWLIAHALKAVADRFGPDNVIFPSLRGQPIFDALHREEVYEQIRFDGNDTLWERMYPAGEETARRLLSPTLPNRFLALAPAAEAESAAEAAEAAIHAELRRIGDCCWTWLKNRHHASDDWRERWDRQIELFPSITWQVFPWEPDIERAIERYRQVSFSDPKPDGPTPAENLRAFYQLATETVPENHRDQRYFTHGQLNNIGFAWAAQYGLADFLHAARRQTRDFPAFVTDPKQTDSVKDALSGREEVIGVEKWWEKLSAEKGGVFEEERGLGAVNIIKRLWCRTEVDCLHKRLDISEKQFRASVRYDSVPDVADKNIRDANGKTSPYVAVIALDGDDMGKWVSGAKCPPFKGQLSAKARDYFDKLVAEDQRRPLNPAYHLQFSEALANFTRLAEPVVRHFEGQLIYAGGDDVLAMVPATRAIDCAVLLRSVFRGEEPTALSKESMTFVEDWLGLKKEIDFHDNPGWMIRVVHDGGSRKELPLIVPGPRADVSCGIAVAHKNHPLQAIVREAQNAEQRAKHHFRRSAMAITLLKRGGETIHWGAKWDGPAFRLYHHFRTCAGYLEKESPVVSARFPYALAELLRPYRFAADLFVEQFEPRVVIEQELRQVIERQSLPESRGRDEPARLEELCREYLDRLAEPEDPEKRRAGQWDEFEKLFLTAAFIHRERGDQ